MRPAWTFCRIPEYWIVDRTPDRAHDDATMHRHRLTLAGEVPA
jgi:hypothetical protein